MTGHRILVIQIGRGDLYHVIPAVAQPVADLPILLRGFGIAVKMRAQSVQIDAHPFVGLVVLVPIDHVGCRRAQRRAQPDLFPADAFAEPGGQQQVAQLGLRVVDRHRVLTRRLGRLCRRYVVAERELVPPLVQTVASRRTVQVTMVVGVAKRLQAVDA